MKPAHLTLPALLVLLVAGSAAAGPHGQIEPQHRPAVPSVQLELPHGLLAYKHRISLPAHALSFGPDAAFQPHFRGVNWLADAGVMSLTLRRPLDYKGGPVRLTLFHQVMSDAAGDITFAVTPVTLNHGNSFETYGSVATDTLPAPQTLTIVLEQSAVIPPGNGFFPDGNWWYFDITRQGSHTGPLRIMSVAIDY